MSFSIASDIGSLSSSTIIDIIGAKVVFDRMCADNICPDDFLLEQITDRLNVDSELLQVTFATRAADMFIALVRLHPRILQDNIPKQNHDILRECSLFPGVKRFESTQAFFEALQIDTIVEGELSYTQYLAACFFSRLEDIPVITFCKSLSGFEKLANTADYELLAALTIEYRTNPNADLLYTICWIAAAPFSGEMKTWRGFMLNSIFAVAAMQGFSSDIILARSSLGLEWATFCMNDGLLSPTKLSDSFVSSIL
ncbi:hypothetical protein SARC_02211 [Sphaeroforma arctica JP610]|uniref:Uncharacterized protein n=1 Tax=Sphaeroforma arctica JP610 TaxID=667725 RepID=A0A0L0GBM1_9EUKA|nr:hypothetical protein SARC_02211 [Sphaeroforma arctica JP610]KNC85638.1 hypothetical protein SARC_02211 [Sphaeroforma arctica JP610]|eukprot:XP_014159540.1 hypothetical protein SARC_02211 [Sphaeroforma arctica JP610]